MTLPLGNLIPEDGDDGTIF